MIAAERVFGLKASMTRTTLDFDSDFNIVKIKNLNDTFLKV